MMWWNGTMKLFDKIAVAFYLLCAVSFTASVIVTALHGAPLMNVAIPAAGVVLTVALAVTKLRSSRKQQEEANAEVTPS